MSMPTWPAPIREVSTPTAKVWMMPISSDATKAPASEPMPPTTTTTKITEPTVAAMPGSVTKALPPITTGQRRQRGAAAEHQHEDARHVVAERLHGVRIGKRRLDHRAMRVRVSSSHSATSINSATSIMKPRYIGNLVPKIVNRGRPEAGGTR